MVTLPVSWSGEKWRTECLLKAVHYTYVPGRTLTAKMEIKETTKFMMTAKLIMWLVWWQKIMWCVPRTRGFLSNSLQSNWMQLSHLGRLFRRQYKLFDSESTIQSPLTSMPFVPNKFEDSQSHALRKVTRKKFAYFQVRWVLTSLLCCLNSFLTECMRDPFCVGVFVLVKRKEFYFLWISNPAPKQTMTQPIRREIRQ